MKKSLQIRLAGLVQGVGFRPFIYRLAQAHHLSGWVCNRNDGVEIYVNGEPDDLEQFITDISRKKPHLSNIDDFTVCETNLALHNGFTIKESVQHADKVTDVSPDLTVCDECMQDMNHLPHRLSYPFINCTNCGPRFSIVTDVPYDRPNTTMVHFEMCEDCKREYEDALDRRFHAQPIACSKCGPRYVLYSNKDEITDLDQIIETTSGIIDGGGVVAIKGLGGYFIACDAHNEHAVNRLRSNKKRYGKPFAVMAGSLQVAESIAFINDGEAQLLTSIQKPVVLLKSKGLLAGSVCQGLNTVGVMLPYMPIHYQLFDKLETDVIVLTSGNLSEEPIAIEEGEALGKLGPHCDVVLTHNRPVANRVDDSVLFMAGGRQRFVRRSRGYVPLPVNVAADVEGILATGAELSNTFCIGKGKQAIMSQHIGDLKNEETYAFYLESIAHFKKIFRFSPEYVVSDLHPDYLSTVLARELNIPHLQVQHHHAHIASCMAEYRLDEQVIGVSFDGTGYGTDGNTWGGEFLLCDLLRLDRLYQFEYMPIPGGDMAVKQPWRTAFSYLYNYFGERVFDLDFLKSQRREDLEMIRYAIERNINCPLSSSAGRLFDAFAAMIGICGDAQYHAEAPMKLEALIHPGVKDCYTYDIVGRVVCFQDVFEAALYDLSQGIDNATVATRFHNTIVKLIREVSDKVREHLGISRIVLSGGTFQNRYLLERVTDELDNNDFTVYTNTKVPSNDGGIALGQMVLAAKMIKRCV